MINLKEVCVFLIILLLTYRQKELELPTDNNNT